MQQISSGLDATTAWTVDAVHNVLVRGVGGVYNVDMLPGECPGRAAGPTEHDVRGDFSGWATQYHYFTIWDYATLVGSGVTVPIGIVALSLSVFLVARAFRPH